MMRSNAALQSILPFLACALLVLGGVAQVNAQETAGETETIIGETAGEVEREGIVYGAYWWAEIEPAAIAAFSGFGIDVVAFRLGTLGFAVISSTPWGAVAVQWDEGGDFGVLSDLSASMEYRAVIDCTRLPSGPRPGENLAAFVVESVVPQLEESSAGVRAVELRLPFSSGGQLTAIAASLRDADLSMPVVLGVNPELFTSLSRDELESLGTIVDGFVIYFTDYDLKGSSPRITDRAWIDATCVEVDALGIPFTAVVPVHNLAVRYPAGETSAAEVLRAVDLAALEEASEVREMGAAGTEYRIVEPVAEPGTPLEVGDRIRLLESLNEIDIEELIAVLPEMAPSCREVDLFRFPLVPGFDPTANEALMAAGQLARPAGEAVGDEDAEKRELDQKYNKGQQIIWMITLGFMMILLMRMFARGKGAGSGKGGGK